MNSIIVLLGCLSLILINVNGCGVPCTVGSPDELAGNCCNRGACGCVQMLGTTAGCDANPGPGSCTPNPTWADQLADLQAKKQLWLSNGVTDYVYEQSDSCFCFGCNLVGKYITITGKTSGKDGTVSCVEIDSADPFLTANGGSLDCEVETPLVDNYRNVENYINDAISFVQDRVNAGCDSGASTDPFIDCEGSVNVVFDETLYYPTSITIEFNSCGAACDAFITYNIGCLTVLQSNIGVNGVPSSYNNTCTDFSYPAATCPSRCKGGFDGCNGCGCDGLGNPTFCTQRACFINEIGTAKCGSCEIGYELNQCTNSCDSTKVSCTRGRDCDSGFVCRKDPECREYSDLRCQDTGKVCVTSRALETACTSDNDCDTENGFGCLEGDRGDGRCLKYQPA